MHLYLIFFIHIFFKIHTSKSNFKKLLWLFISVESFFSINVLLLSITYYDIYYIYLYIYQYVIKKNFRTNNILLPRYFLYY